MKQGRLSLDEATLDVSALPPFRLDLTAWALRRRPSNRIDRWDGQVYRRALPIGADREPVEVAVCQSGPAEKPELRVSVAGAAARPHLFPAVTPASEHLLGLSINLSDFYALAERDPTLAPLARRFYGLKPPRFPSIFEALTNAIACQQVTLTLGILLLNRLAQTYGRAYRNPAAGAGESTEIVANAFPAPEDLVGVAPEALRSLGFSHQKACYLGDLAGAIASGKLDLEALAELDNAEAVARLRQLRGVGRWSAEYVLLRGLGRLDVFPGDDVGARNNLQQWLGLGEKLDYHGVKQVVARWQPYSGLVYLHLLLDSLAKRGVIMATDPAREPHFEVPC